MRSRRILTLCFAVAFLFAASPIVPPADASSLPPASGDWVIEPAEDITISDQDLLLPGSLYVNGRLVLNGCTIRVAPTGCGDRGVEVNGTLEATDTTFVSVTAVPDAEWLVLARFAVNAGSNAFTGCRFEHFFACFLGASQNAFDSCEFVGGWSPWINFKDDSRNDLVNCTLCHRPKFNFNDRCHRF